MPWRGRLIALSGGLVVAALAYGCTDPPGVTCTEIGSRAGISFVVDREAVNPNPDPALTVQICQDDCVRRTVDLQPGSVSAGQTCTADDPDGSCSASASPDGTQVGFADVESLTAGSVKVTGRFPTGAGGHRLAGIIGTAEPTYPNGSSCPAGGPQATVHITPTGLR